MSLERITVIEIQLCRVKRSFFHFFDDCTEKGRGRGIAIGLQLLDSIQLDVSFGVKSWSLERCSSLSPFTQSLLLLLLMSLLSLLLESLLHFDQFLWSWLVENVTKIHNRALFHLNQRNYEEQLIIRPKFQWSDWFLKRSQLRGNELRWKTKKKHKNPKKLKKTHTNKSRKSQPIINFCQRKLNLNNIFLFFCTITIKIKSFTENKNKNKKIDQ